MSNLPSKAEQHLERRIVSRHFFRRRARAQRHKVQAQNHKGRYSVVPASRGPFRWYVVEIT